MWVGAGVRVADNVLVLLKCYCVCEYQATIRAKGTMILVTVHKSID